MSYNGHSANLISNQAWSSRHSIGSQKLKTNDSLNFINIKSIICERMMFRDAVFTLSLKGKPNLEFWTIDHFFVCIFSTFIIKLYIFNELFPFEVGKGSLFMQMKIAYIFLHILYKIVMFGLLVNFLFPTKIFSEFYVLFKYLQIRRPQFSNYLSFP